MSEFVNYTHFQAKSYATKNLIMTMGESHDKCLKVVMINM